MKGTQVVAHSFIAIALSHVSMTSAQEADVKSGQVTLPSANAAQSVSEHAADQSGYALTEIIVTARKRAESDIAVPVSITALDSERIEKKAIFDSFDLAQQTPTVAVNNNASGVGGNIYLRGVGSSVNSGASIDQSVSFEFDGVPISRGNFLRIGNYDLDQIQILKGPQALFFGKNSAAGVVAFTSKNPTDERDVTTRVGYEFDARTRYVEAGVGGPLADSLKMRLFGRYARSDGGDRNESYLALPANTIRPNTVFAADRRFPQYEDEFVRATAVLDPIDTLNINIKASYNERDGEGPGALRERFYCPRGAAQTGLLATTLAGAPNPALASALAVDDCKLNGTIFIGDMNPAFLTAPGAPTDSAGGSTSKILLASSQIKWDFADHFSLSSVTGFARAKEFIYDQFTFSLAGPPGLTVGQYAMHRQFTQELRLESDLDGPLNFMIGGFYQDAFFRSYIQVLAVPPYIRPIYEIPNDVYSGFAQLTWDINDQLELAGGARYTHETKSLTLERAGVIEPVDKSRLEFNNTSPEATLTWRPSQDLTFFGAYRSGYKSGGYATILTGGQPVPANRDFTFKPEKAQGFEIGSKALLFDRSLRMDVTAYHYTYKDQQVGSVEVPFGGPPIIRITNAAKIIQKGVELETSYQTGIEGLRLNAAANYNRANYSSYLAPCFVGQSIADGCAFNFVNGQFRAQQLAGKQAPNAPRWVASAGFSYETPLSDRMEIGISGDALYRSSYNVLPDLQPQGRQRGYTTFNLQLTVADVDDGWELGLYGKNLTDTRRALEGNVIGFTGITANTGTVNGGVQSYADIGGGINPGRSVLFQVTLRPSAW